MSRRWHVEHGDGREWTVEDLRAAYGPSASTVCIDGTGLTYLLDAYGRWSRIWPTDMEVVWDE